MAEPSPNPPDDRRGQADKETLRREARKETLALLLVTTSWIFMHLYIFSKSL